MEQEVKVTTYVKLDFIDSLNILFGRSLKIETHILIPQEKSITHYNAWATTEVIKTSSHFIKQDKPKYGYTAKHQD